MRRKETEDNEGKEAGNETKSPFFVLSLYLIT
jgi:hypothetical protein